MAQTTSQWSEYKALLMKEAQIQEHELPNWWHLSVSVFRFLVALRRSVGRPMFYATHHGPNCGAVPPDSTSHGQFSLHKWGINHDVCYATQKLVIDTNEVFPYEAKAIDFHIDGLTVAEQYFEAEKWVSHGGIGVYPHWRNPGLHVDFRSSIHPASGARWYQDDKGNYHKLTLSKLKEFSV